MLDAKVVMACGHVASTRYTTEEGSKIPICSLCASKNPLKAREVVSLKNRIARCNMCSNPVPSTTDLFAFVYNMDGEIDSYYDGCMGW